jgi:hypothetical protein
MIVNPGQKEDRLMAATAGYDVNEARLLMTLNLYSYLDENPLPTWSITQQEDQMRKDIDQALSQSKYAQWQVVWGPALNADRSNMMYVAGNGANQYAVSVRGTDWFFFLNWLEDFASILGLTPFPYVLSSIPVSGKPRIAIGTSVGLQQLMGMRGTTSGSAQSDLPSFLEQLPAGSEIFVTGHSLGGCLASVLAAWLAFTLGSAANLKVYTFAAPSAGNQSFADYFNTLFTPAGQQSTAFRLFNTWDVVPNAWASLPAIEQLYQPFPPCPGDIKWLIQKALKAVGTEYVQVGTDAQGSARPLPGHFLFWPPGPKAAMAAEAPAAAQPEDLTAVGINIVGDAAFLYELALQHGSYAYLDLLGAPSAPAALLKLRGKLLALGA